MKRLPVYLLLFIVVNATAQIKTSGLKDGNFPTFYQQRSSLFRLLPQTRDDIVFLGNSITNGNEWNEMFDDIQIKNRGISGDLTAGVLNRLDEITARKPAKIFLLVGINNLAAGDAPDTVAKNIFRIAQRIHNESPDTRLYVQSILPVNDAFNKFPGHVNKSEQIKQTNALLQNGTVQNQYTFINLYPYYCNAQQKLDTLYTNDGLHQKGAGYMLWKHLIYPYVYDLQDKPSLLPKPNTVIWTGAGFPLYQCHYIVLKDTALKKEANWLQKYLDAKGWIAHIVDHSPDDGSPAIILQQGVVAQSAHQEEAYRLTANEKIVTITAKTPHGCFNALQTLAQLMRDNVIVDGVDITDYPAFSWRGFMVDVGRNYESVDLLKQQIETMARYRLNVFHFHFTEDIAWRLQIKHYPQLTDPANMQRNAGAYYTIDEVKELIKFCGERYITLVPEIDIPGHSAAFRRVFHCDMQSDSGMVIVENILAAFCTTYDLPYLHIGGDEVKIINKNFLPTMISYVHSLGKQTIGWSPGGNLDDGTIRQLWMRDGAVNPKYKYIDSRNLYINHMDPLESIVSIYNRKIGDADKETPNVLGGTLCSWPDRNVTKQEDLVTMSPVYPAILTFAERTWAGGGKPGWNTMIMPGDTAFATFENRLIDQQKQFFEDRPFPYVRQAGIKWQLYGPYANKGKLDAKLGPEKAGFDSAGQKHQAVTGGTVILRHFWYPFVNGTLKQPTDSTTYYALAQSWSDKDTTALMWIGFYNISRSVPTSTAELNTWDDRGSEISINGQLITPPRWLHAGQTGNSEKPLVDEGYEYREPTMVKLKKGWNKILVKLPVGGFKAGKSQNPVKWMFTAVFVKPFGKGFIADDNIRFTDDQ